MYSWRYYLDNTTIRLFPLTIKLKYIFFHLASCYLILQSHVLWKDNLHYNNKAKCKTQDLDQGIDTSQGMKKLRTALPWRIWGCWWMSWWTWADKALLKPRELIVSWAAPKQMWPAGQGKWFCLSTPLRWDPAHSTAPSSGVPSPGRTSIFEESPEEGRQID